MIKKDFFNIIDLGASKIRFSVFDKDFNEKFFKSRSVKLQGENSDYFNMLEDIIKETEKKISSHIQDVILIFDPLKLLTIEISLSKNLGGGAKLLKVYNSLILELNQIINTNYPNYSIAHILLDSCIVDKKIFNELPKHKKEIKDIKADFKIICFSKKVIKFLKNDFNKININVTNFFCASYVKTYSYLKKMNLKKAAFLEIGLNRSTFIFYEKNKLKYIKTIPIGGNFITKDISNIFKITIEEAEKLKKSFNSSETEFSYEDISEGDQVSAKQIFNKNISINLLKKVILYRIQEIIDLTFKKSKIEMNILDIKESELFLVGDGSLIFSNNSFHLNDDLQFKNLNHYIETDNQICNAALVHYLNNYESPKLINKKQGLFERFFNFFEK